MQSYINNSGMLDVGNGHQLYWEDWGNPTADPVLHIHGGPGGGFNDTYKYTFNPRKHRVIFYDQRGCGRSTPFAETKNNTTQDLIADIEKLREHLNIEQFSLFGGSWGSTLSLVYAIAHPERVKHMIMWGIYLGRKFENDFIANGYPRYHYPEAWERFIGLVPEEHRGSGDSITKYYNQMLQSDNQVDALKYADEWTLWESTTLTIDYHKDKIEEAVLGDENNLPIARLETQYFLNGCYIPENYIIDSIDKIKHIPAYIVQGRFDNCTPPISAYELSKAYGDRLTLQFVNSGHKRSDPQLFNALTAIVNVVHG